MALSFSKDARQTIVNTIFGRRRGDAREKALADASSADEFHRMLEDLEAVWNPHNIVASPGSMLGSSSILEW